MQVPGPDTRVVELRVHGILGARPHDLTDSVASVDVAGDGVGRIVRPADRLLRPVPGPALAAGDRTVSRVVEGYVWGGMTSGGRKATWALLFPFALANMAHWMLPPSRPDSRTSRVLATVLRALLRLAALLMTTLFTAQLTVIGVDLLAAQCLSPGSGCLPAVPDGLRGSGTGRAALGIGVVTAVVLAMHRTASASWRVRTPQAQGPARSASAPVLPGGNIVTEPETPALRALHTVAALSTVVMIVSGGPLRVSTDPRWVGATALLALSALATLLLDDPSGSRPRSRAAFLFGRVPRRSLLGAAAVLLLTSVVSPSPDGPLPGSGTTIDVVNAALLITCAVVGVLLVPAALLSAPHRASLPRRLRPWAGGWMAAPVLLVACLLGEGFGAGLALSTRQVLGSRGLVLPEAYDTVTLLWGTVTVLLVLTAAFVLLWLGVRWLRAIRTGTEVSRVVALLHAGRRQDQHRAARAWERARLRRDHVHQGLLLVAGLLAAGTILAVSLRLTGVPDPRWAGWLIALGVGALATLALASLRMVHLAIKRPEAARQVAVLCDLALFWPREAHPVVPPCYALKVVPELVGRAAEHLADPETRVVLVGHSQGSLLAAVATARLLEELPEADRERVGLVTAGSSLQWGYSRAFPGAVPHDALGHLAGSLGGRWRSLCRGTDPLGGAVGTWNRQVFDGKLIGVGFRPDGGEGPLSSASRGPTGALVLGGDHWLPDPQRGPFAHRRWVPGVLEHSEYSGDPEWDRAVAMAAGLEMPQRGASLPLQASATETRDSALPLSTAPGPRTAPAPAEGTDEAPDVEGTGDGEPAPPSTRPVSHAPTASTTRRTSARPTAERGTTAEHPTADGDPAATAVTAGDPEPAADPGARAETSPASETASATETAPPPEVVEPRGGFPPWERAPALRTSDR